MSTIGNILRKAGQNRLYILLENGESITEVVNAALPKDKQVDITTATGWDVMDALAGLDKDVRKSILDTTTECEIEIPSTTPELAQLLKSNAGSAGKWKIAIAVWMSLLVGLVVITYCLIMYDNATYTHISPEWPQVTLVIMVPGAIVWAWFGVLTKENRDIISAVIGEIPKAGIGGAIVDAVLRRKPTQETVTVTQTTESTEATESTEEPVTRPRGRNKGNPA